MYGNPQPQQVMYAQPPGQVMYGQPQPQAVMYAQQPQVYANPMAQQPVYGQPMYVQPQGQGAMMMKK